MIGSATDAGQGFVYSGQIEKGQMHGKGTLVYPNGTARQHYAVLLCPWAAWRWTNGFKCLARPGSK
jgi:hypothetical protein